MSVVNLASKRKLPRECADILRDMAGQAERGEIVSVSVVFERPDGSVGNWNSGTRSKLKMAGALLDASVRRLGYVEE